MVQLVGRPGGDTFLAMHGVADLDQVVHRCRHLQSGLFDQVAASGVEQHGASLDAVAVGVSLVVTQRGLRAGDEIGRVPVGRGGVGVFGELIEVGDPTGSDPASLIDEGDEYDVVGGAAGGQLQVHALVVDGEGLDIEGDLDAGLFLELREISLQEGVEREGEGGAPDRRAGVFRFRLTEHSRRVQSHNPCPGGGQDAPPRQTHAFFHSSSAKPGCYELPRWGLYDPSLPPTTLKRGSFSDGRRSGGDGEGLMAGTSPAMTSEAGHDVGGRP